VYIAVYDSKGLCFLVFAVTFTFVYYCVMSPQEKCVLPKCNVTDAPGQYIVKINVTVPFLASDFLNEHNTIALCVPCSALKNVLYLHDTPTNAHLHMLVHYI